jgi:hypothetical protein
MQYFEANCFSTAPVPRKKEGRAARLAALMENGSTSDLGESSGAGTMPEGDDPTASSAQDNGTKDSSSDEGNIL